MVARRRLRTPPNRLGTKIGRSRIVDRHRHRRCAPRSQPARRGIRRPRVLDHMVGGAARCLRLAARRAATAAVQRGRWWSQSTNHAGRANCGPSWRRRCGKSRMAAALACYALASPSTGWRSASRAWCWCSPPRKRKPRPCSLCALGFLQASPVLRQELARKPRATRSGCAMASPSPFIQTAFRSIRGRTLLAVDLR